MIIETGLTDWPYKIHVRVGQNMDLRKNRIYGDATIEHFSSAPKKTTIARWTDYKGLDGKIDGWWMFLRDEKTAIRALTIIGGI